ncbi:VIR protein [Plasmodium vivax]|uniref:VIR protein n=1 Tax=Plasmodium vivax TaxID=5855 RepID=A0A1G4ECX5_PLAVI|nr:VIR protein [Plasmodium vivax]
MKQVLDSLPSSFNYHNLNNKYGRFGDEDKCEELQSKFPNSPHVRKFCMSLTEILSRNFNYVSTNLYGLYKDEPCRILEFWMFNYLYNTLEKELKKISISSAKGYFFYTWNKVVLDPNCHLNDMHTYNETYFNKMKKFFDYVQDYDTIEKAIKETKMECSKEYFNYIKEGIESYKELKGLCDTDNTDNTKPFCAALNSIGEKVGHEKLSSSICIKVNEALSRTEETSDFPLESETRSLGEYQNRASPLASYPLKARSTERDSFERDPPARGSFKGESLDHPAQPLDSELDTPTRNNKLVSTSLISGVTFFTLFMMYKFTPIGSRLGTFFRNKKIPHPYMQEEVERSRHLFERENEHSNVTAYNTRHNIGYQP